MRLGRRWSKARRTHYQNLNRLGRGAQFICVFGANITNGPEQWEAHISRARDGRGHPLLARRPPARFICRARRPHRQFQEKTTDAAGLPDNPNQVCSMGK